MAAAQKLQDEDGISIEVVDPRTLVPLDIELISRSVQKTGRAMIVVQAVYTGGYASHISHEITRTSFSSLKAPVKILSAYDVPPPMAYPLEVENIPSVDKIVRVVKEQLGVAVPPTVPGSRQSSSGRRSARSGGRRGARRAPASA